MGSIGKIALREYIVRRGGRVLGSVRSTRVITHAVITWDQAGLPRIEVASWHSCFDAATEALRALKRDNPDLGADIALAHLADGPALL